MTWPARYMEDGARVRPELPRVETARGHIRNAQQILAVLREKWSVQPRPRHLGQYVAELHQAITAVQRGLGEAVAQIEEENL